MIVLEAVGEDGRLALVDVDAAAVVDRLVSGKGVAAERGRMPDDMDATTRPAGFVVDEGVPRDQTAAVVVQATPTQRSHVGPKLVALDGDGTLAHGEAGAEHALIPQEMAIAELSRAVVQQGA